MYKSFKTAIPHQIFSNPGPKKLFTKERFEKYLFCREKWLGSCGGSGSVWPVQTLMCLCWCSVHSKKLLQVFTSRREIRPTHVSYQCGQCIHPCPSCPRAVGTPAYLPGFHAFTGQYRYAFCIPLIYPVKVGVGYFVVTGRTLLYTR